MSTFRLNSGTVGICRQSGGIHEMLAYNLNRRVLDVIPSKILQGYGRMKKIETYFQ